MYICTYDFWRQTVLKTHPLTCRECPCGLFLSPRLLGRMQAKFTVHSLGRKTHSAYRNLCLFPQVEYGCLPFANKNSELCCMYTHEFFHFSWVSIVRRSRGPYFYRRVAECPPPVQIVATRDLVCFTRRSPVRLEKDKRSFRTVQQ